MHSFNVGVGDSPVRWLNLALRSYNDIVLLCELCLLLPRQPPSKDAKKDDWSAQARLDQRQVAAKSRRPPTTTYASHAQDENAKNRNMAQEILEKRMDKYAQLARVIVQRLSIRGPPLGRQFRSEGPA